MNNSLHSTAQLPTHLNPNIQLCAHLCTAPGCSFVSVGQLPAYTDESVAALLLHSLFYITYHFAHNTDCQGCREFTWQSALPHSVWLTKRGKSIQHWYVCAYFKLFHSLKMINRHGGGAAILAENTFERRGDAVRVSDNMKGHRELMDFLSWRVCTESGTVGRGH